MQTTTIMNTDPKKIFIRYKDVEILDESIMQMLNEYAQGDPEIVQDIIDSFEPEATTLIRDIENAVEKENAESLRIAIHSLAGISGSVGATRLKSICTDLENLIKRGNPEKAFEEVTLIFLGFNEVVSLLREM